MLAGRLRLSCQQGRLGGDLRGGLGEDKEVLGLAQCANVPGFRYWIVATRPTLTDKRRTTSDKQRGHWRVLYSTAIIRGHDS